MFKNTSKLVIILSLLILPVKTNAMNIANQINETNQINKNINQIHRNPTSINVYNNQNNESLSNLTIHQKPVTRMEFTDNVDPKILMDWIKKINKDKAKTTTNIMIKKNMIGTVFNSKIFRSKDIFKIIRSFPPVIGNQIKFDDENQIITIDIFTNTANKMLNQKFNNDISQCIDSYIVHWDDIRKSWDNSISYIFQEIIKLDCFRNDQDGLFFINLHDNNNSSSTKQIFCERQFHDYYRDINPNIDFHDFAKFLNTIEYFTYLGLPNKYQKANNNSKFLISKEEYKNLIKLLFQNSVTSFLIGYKHLASYAEHNLITKNIQNSVDELLSSNVDINSVNNFKETFGKNCFLNFLFLCKKIIYHESLDNNNNIKVSNNDNNFFINKTSNVLYKLPKLISKDFKDITFQEKSVLVEELNNEINNAKEGQNFITYFINKMQQQFLSNTVNNITSAYRQTYEYNQHLIDMACNIEKYFNSFIHFCITEYDKELQLMFLTNIIDKNMPKVQALRNAIHNILFVIDRNGYIKNIKDNNIQIKKLPELHKNIYDYIAQFIGNDIKSLSIPVTITKYNKKYYTLFDGTKRPNIEHKKINFNFNTTTETVPNLNNRQILHINFDIKKETKQNNNINNIGNQIHSIIELTHNNEKKIFTLETPNIINNNNINNNNQFINHKRKYDKEITIETTKKKKK